MTKKASKTTITLNEGEAVLVVQPNGMQLFFPQDALPHVKLAIAMAMRTRDREWVAELLRWAEEMQQFGQEPSQHMEATTRPMKGHPHAGIETAFWGVLGQDPELKTSKTGKPFASFGCVVTVGEDMSQWLLIAKN